MHMFQEEKIQEQNFVTFGQRVVCRVCKTYTNMLIIKNSAVGLNRFTFYNKLLLDYVCQVLYILHSFNEF